MVKNLPASAGDLRDMSLHWVRGWQPAPEFLPGNPHGQRSLMGSTESTHTHTHTTHMNIGVHIYFLTAAAAKSLQSCPTLCNPMDCSLPGFSVHGIFQATVLEWGAIAFSLFLN